MNSSWISAIVRKDLNVWYSGCNNLNLTVFPEKDDSCVKPLPYRNMPGAADKVLSADATLDGDGYTLTTANYTDSEGTYLNRWYTVRYEINEKSYKMYLDDTLLVDLHYPSRNLLNFGYVSLGGCQANVYFDDFVLENLDTEAPPALEEEKPEETPPVTPPVEDPKDDTPKKEKKDGCGSSVSVVALSALLPVGFVLFKKRRS